jgi:CheY-like chemotaxis protein
MLQQRGASVKLAGSTEEAMTALENLRPDVLVSDIAMPGEDGMTFIRRLRALGAARGGQTKALALTALAGEEDHERALAAGFQLYLSKPVDMERLVAAVAALGKSTPRLAAGSPSTLEGRPGPDDV